MISDRYSLPLSTSSQAAADLFVDALDRIFSFDVDAVPTLERALEVDDGFALAHAVLAVQRQLQGDTSGAAGSVECAVQRSSGTSAREASFIDSIGALVSSGGARGATGVIPRLEAHLADYPRDYFIVGQLQTARSQNGERDRKQQSMAYYRQLAPHYGDDWAFSGAYGMVLQENDLLEEAGERAQISLRQRPKNANAIHPVAHCYYETSNHAEGEKVIGDWLDGYEWRAPYHCHLSWHMALFSLAMGHFDRVQQIWDKDIAPVDRASTLLVDSASILWRLQLYDCLPATMDWGKVRPLAEAALDRPAVSFLFSHSALYYAATGDEATFDRMMDSLRDLSAQGHHLAPAMTAFVSGLRAFSHGAFDDAATTMHAFAEDFPRFGGSNAQAEVYTETYIEACLRAQRYDWAEVAIRRRLQRKPSARDCFWLGRSLAGQEKFAEAGHALDQSRDAWSGEGVTTPEVLRVESLRASLPLNP